MNSKRIIISSVVTLLFAIIFYFLFSTWNRNTKPEASIKNLTMLEQMEQDGLPVFSLVDIYGKKINFTKPSDKIRIVNFWASWCEPCLEEIPSLVELVNAFPDKIELFAVSGDYSKDDIQAFLKSFPKMKNKNIHIFIDSDQKIMEMYGTDRLPESYIADKNGLLVKKIVGSINWHTKESEAFIRAIFDKK
jgi:cytochrome c biogenesis protein CcmG, thiol:disulfide interchange protein DsbE